MSATNYWPTDVSDADVEAIADVVGHGPAAWDCVEPKELIAAAWNHRRALPPTALTTEQIEIIAAEHGEIGRYEGKLVWCKFSSLGLYGFARSIDAAAPAQGDGKEDAWQPIETAPTNESVLVFIPRADHYGPGIYRALQPDFGTRRPWQVTGLHNGRDCDVDYQPTHWMPLPPAPGNPAAEARK